ncbi:MAG: 16S rRNA (uracil(1498)-N(3))-methyltransferase [Alphaproteobacteria bacterium]|nr:16S rRNA (uracil(1498)-N(3))-methyltransferase [Alphaproteobacteria bacterium]
MHAEEKDKIWTYPRIYVDQPLKEETTINLTPAHAHYFKNVLRRQDGNFIRLFNGTDGEWIATLEGLTKKSGNAALRSQSRPQPETPTKTALYFAPIKKSRMDLLIEKAVELGVTDLIPTLTARTENRKFKSERIESQILEAAEQCERLDIPTLHNTIAINALPKDIVIHACIERDDSREESPFIAEIKDKDLSFLVGPEGGFTDQEIQALHQKSNIKPISLGDRIYRAETASIVCLTHAAFLNQK